MERWVRLWPMANWPNEQVVDVSISSFHHQVYLGLSAEVRVMARHNGQWTVRDSLWLAQPAAESDMIPSKPTAEGNMNAYDGSAGRRDIEDVLKTVQVSGKTVAVQTTQGGLQLYYCPRYGNPTEGTISQFDKYKTLFYCMTSFW